jgi:hypothetical protein
VFMNNFFKVILKKDLETTSGPTVIHSGLQIIEFISICTFRYKGHGLQLIPKTKTSAGVPPRIVGRT